MKDYQTDFGGNGTQDYSTYQRLLFCQGLDALELPIAKLSSRLSAAYERNPQGFEETFHGADCFPYVSDSEPEIYSLWLAFPPLVEAVYIMNEIGARTKLSRELQRLPENKCRGKSGHPWLLTCYKNLNGGKSYCEEHQDQYNGCKYRPCPNKLCNKPVPNRSDVNDDSIPRYEMPYCADHIQEIEDTKALADQKLQETVQLIEQLNQWFDDHAIDSLYLRLDDNTSILPSKCGICLEDFVAASGHTAELEQCGHHFCAECLDVLFKHDVGRGIREMRCPYCRKDCYPMVYSTPERSISFKDSGWTLITTVPISLVGDAAAEMRGVTL